MDSSELIQMSKDLDTPLIVHDSNKDENFVIMGVDSYKDLKLNNSVQTKTTTNKKGVLDKINKNISLLIKQQQDNKQNLRARVLKEEMIDNVTSEGNKKIEQAVKKKQQKEEVESKIEYDSINEDTRSAGWQKEGKIEIEEVKPEESEKNRKDIPYQDQN